MNPNAVRCMWSGFSIERSKPRIPLRYRQIRWPGSLAAWSSRRTEGSWEIWLLENQRPFERLGTRTLSTWRHSWSRGSPELRRTSGWVSCRSNGDARGIDEGFALRLRTVTAEPIPAVSQPVGRVLRLRAQPQLSRASTSGNPYFAAE